MGKSVRQLQHLAIIMDGNRRWAKNNQLSIKKGHESGAKKLSDVADWCINLGIKYLTVYAFSTENWKRELSEINDLMSLLIKYLSSKENDFNKNGIKIKVIGVENNIKKDIIESIRRVEKNTENNDVLQVNIAFNYGGRKEIVDVARLLCEKVQNKELKLEEINEDLFEENLYYGKIPNPDLLVRTGGDVRISNFLLWEIAYSEFYFTNIFWPDFSEELLGDIVNNFKNRERRYGGTIK